MKGLIESQIFSLGIMSSGRVFLSLNSEVEWENFPEYAERLLSVLDGVIQKKTDSFDVRIWEVSIRGESLRLVFDDFPVMVSLESVSEAGDKILLDVEKKLTRKLKGSE